MTRGEQKEFRELKHIRADRGFWTDKEKERWDYLHKLQGKKLQKLINYCEEVRKSQLN